MKTSFAVIALIAMLSVQVAAELGVDDSHHAHQYSENTFKCLKQSNFDFAILNVFHRDTANSFFPSNFKNAKKASFTHIDAIATLCSNYKKAKKNVDKKIKKDLGKHWGQRLFLEIAPLEGCWSSNQTYNLEYVEAVARSLHRFGFHLGVFTNESNWNQIMGDSGKKTILSELPLMFSLTDGDADFSQGNSKQYNFSGWHMPEIKQYALNSTKYCGTDINLDYVDGAPIYSPKNCSAGTWCHHHVHENKDKKSHSHHSHGHSLKTKWSKKSDKSESVSLKSKQDSSTISVASTTTEYNSFESSCEDSTCFYTTTTEENHSGDEPTDSDGWTYGSSYDGPTEEGDFDDEEAGDEFELDNEALDDGIVDAVEGAADAVLDVVEDILMAIFAIFGF